MRLCDACSLPGTLGCAGCKKSVAYCSKEHQVLLVHSFELERPSTRTDFILFFVKNVGWKSLQSLQTNWWCVLSTKAQGAGTTRFRLDYSTSSIRWSHWCRKWVLIFDFLNRMLWNIVWFLTLFFSDR